MLQLELGSGNLTILAESINGADGLAFHQGRLVVAANQADIYPKERRIFKVEEHKP